MEIKMNNVLVCFQYTEFNNMIYDYYDFNVEREKEKIGEDYIFIEDDEVKIKMIKYLYESREGSSIDILKLLLEYLLDNDKYYKFDSRMFRSIVMLVERGCCEILV